MSAHSHPRPVVLVILDGWGHRELEADNAIAAASTPVLDQITHDYPSGFINASELHVGLPVGQMGNSEVGHMNIGSGRVILQDLPRIDAAIADGTLTSKIAQLGITLAPGRTCHLLGLLSPGGVHAHQTHMAALGKILAAQGMKVAVHAIVDGRDTPPQSAQEYVRWFEEEIRDVPNISIATLSGRYYTMDRDKRWERVQKAYDTMVSGADNRFASAQEAISQSYASGVTDEFLVPAAIGDYAGMQEGDVFVMANFRADRAREILDALLNPDFAGFIRSKTVAFARAVGMVEYASQLNPFLVTLFPPEPLTQIFGEVIAEAGLKQLRIAETEKYAHVTFFFNAGREDEFPGEERILVASPKVATYDLKPEMSAYLVTDKLVEAIESGNFDVIVVNYANTDMVGHTGNIAAAIQAVEAVDRCVGRVVEATLKQGGALFITADHGNAEMMFDHDTQQPHTAHTLNLVPAIIVADRLKGTSIRLPEGCLGDVAPTLLHLLGISKPSVMTGRSLLDANAW